MGYLQTVIHRSTGDPMKLSVLHGQVPVTFNPLPVISDTAARLGG